VPGDYAAAEAMKALSLGLHVMLFSDNVDIDEELAVKRHAEGVSEDVKAISPILWVQNRITPNKVGKCKSARQTSAPSSMLCTRLSNYWGAKSIVRLDALRKQRDLTEHTGDTIADVACGMLVAGRSAVWRSRCPSLRS